MATDTSQTHFDYIIVGGGAAGAVLASRLSEESRFQVALVEAGPDMAPGEEPDDILDAYPIVAYFNQSYHWQNIKVHLKEPRSPKEAPRRYEQAKVIGGGTAINGQFAFRGLPWDFADWVAEGAEGWDWDSVLPFYRKLETDLDFGDEPAHGDQGPLPLQRITRERWSPFTEAVASALEAQGLQNIRDHNGCSKDGFFPMTMNNVAGKRVSAARAYLTREVRGRPNLTVFGKTEVRKLVFDGSRVSGVEVTKASHIKTLKAGREVILSAGALQSPAMLMRAGIGPADHLKSMGLEVRADRPGVGQNLQDHPMVALAAFLPKAARLPATMRRHIQMGYRYSSGVAGTTPGDMFMLPSNRAAWHPLGRKLASMLVCVNRSYSRGRVQLKSSDPAIGPAINFNQLSDERDLLRLEDGMRRLMRIVDDPAVAAEVREVFPATFSERVRKLGAVNTTNWWLTLLAGAIMETGSFSRKLMIEKLIVPDVTLDGLRRSPNMLRAWIMENACGSWHASGTCRLGAPDDPAAVVDPNARVIGVDGLRVVDASLMPSIISGNTMLTTIMAGEKIADAIKAEAGY